MDDSESQNRKTHNFKAFSERRRLRMRTMLGNCLPLFDENILASLPKRHDYDYQQRTSRNIKIGFSPQCLEPADENGPDDNLRIYGLPQSYDRLEYFGSTIPDHNFCLPNTSQEPGGEELESSSTKILRCYSKHFLHYLLNSIVPLKFYANKYYNKSVAHLPPASKSSIFRFPLLKRLRHYSDCRFKINNCNSKNSYSKIKQKRLKNNSELERRRLTRNPLKGSALIAICCVIALIFDKTVSTQHTHSTQNAQGQNNLNDFSEEKVRRIVADGMNDSLKEENVRKSFDEPKRFDSIDSESGSDNKRSNFNNNEIVTQRIELQPSPTKIPSLNHAQRQLKAKNQFLSDDSATTTVPRNSHSSTLSTNATLASKEGSTKKKFYDIMNIMSVYSNEQHENFFFRDEHSSLYLIKISKESWNSYNKFKKDTCREKEEIPIDGRLLNNTDSGYFSWEENMFHQELRKIILPETQNNRLTSLIGTPFLRELDPRLFMSMPKSMCRAKKKYELENEEIKKLEPQHFEDYLINKVLSPSIWLHSQPSSNNSNKKKNKANKNETATSVSDNNKKPNSDDGGSSGIALNITVNEN